MKTPPQHNDVLVEHRVLIEHVIKDIVRNSSVVESACAGLDHGQHKSEVPMNSSELENMIRAILAEKSTQTTSPEATSSGVFSQVDRAIDAAYEASKAYMQQPLKIRSDIIALMRQELEPLISEMAMRSAAETGMGNVMDKVAKNQASLFNTPGVEDLTTTALTGDGGMVLFERSPFGVIGAITPSTNPTETILNNSISMLAAGNAIYFSPHPGAKAVSLWLIAKIEEIAWRVSGIHNLVVTVAEPTAAVTQAMMAHPRIALLAVTGGPAIVGMAMKTGKKVIGAGPGNPPVIVDETAFLPQAAKDIVDGASFDNNVLCIAEKCVIAVESIAESLMIMMEKEGAWRVTKAEDLEKLRRVVINERGEANKALVGKTPAVILKAAGIAITPAPRLIIAEVPANDPLVSVEQLMPVLPIVKVSDFDCALKLALTVENEQHHTAMMHSQNITRLNTAAKVMQTSIFVKNGPSYAGLGIGGEGFTTFTIATPTGEGTTSARTFTRHRRCVLTSGFSIR